MSKSMKWMRDRLVYRLGESYGRIRLVWLCQKYGVTPLDEVPERMKKELFN